MADIENPQSGGTLVNGGRISDEDQEKMRQGCEAIQAILDSQRGVDSIRLDLPKLADCAESDPVTIAAAKVRHRIGSLIEAFWILESQAHEQRAARERTTNAAIKGITDSQKAAENASQDRETLLRAGRHHGLSAGYAEAVSQIENFIEKTNNLDCAVNALTLSQRSELLDIRDNLANRSKEAGRYADAILKPED